MTTTPTMDARSFIIQMSVRDKKTFTEEQIEFMSDFTKSKIGFADPGTGKTATCVAGLVVAELVNKIPADEILAMSFTRLATVELANRHATLCKKLGIKSKVNFRTLDSMCLEIITKNFDVLGMESVDTKESLTIEEVADYILEFSEQHGIKINPQRVRSIVWAIRALNSALIFDRDHVEASFEFKQANIDYEGFTKIRAGVYNLNKVLNQIPIGDISLYALEILTRSPEVSQEFKARHRLMLVDEFQDMSLLKLRLLSLLTQELVVVGDMKQQIYAFNGASPEIVDHYKEFFPNHTEHQLTQSFRCDNNIAEFSRMLIKHNKMGGQSFKGVDRNGSVHIYQDHKFDLENFIKGIQEDYVANRNVFEKNIMFLSRNNLSIIGIAEMLYKYRIPFRIPKFRMAHQIPVIEDLVALAELARNPENPNKLEILNKIMPEFNKYATVHQNPIYKIMRKTGEDFFSITYNYQNVIEGELLTHALMEAREAYLRGEVTGKVFNCLWKAYEEIYLRHKAFYLEQEPKYYLNIVKDIVNAKPLQKFLSDEIEKDRWTKEWTEQNEGIRCYTFHASKGTEADIVHIIDADQGIIPNVKQLDRAIKANCSLTAARDVRSERSLVFVAATRAKEELHIHTNGQLSSLFTEFNEYQALDAVYESNKTTYNDVPMFEEFYKMDIK